MWHFFLFYIFLFNKFNTHNPCYHLLHPLSTKSTINKRNHGNHSSPSNGLRLHRRWVCLRETKLQLHRRRVRLHWTELKAENVDMPDGVELRIWSCGGTGAMACWCGAENVEVVQWLLAGIKKKRDKKTNQIKWHIGCHITCKLTTQVYSSMAWFWFVW